MSDPLAILFGSPARVKLLRFFLFNPNKEFTFDDISRRARLVRRTARTEVDDLEKAGVITKKNIFVPVEGQTKKMKVLGYALDKKFIHARALQTFLYDTAPIDDKNILRHLRKAGTLDFVATAGALIHDFEHELDLFITMKKVDQKKMETAIRNLEGEIGMEIRFVLMTSEELFYRIGLHDRLVRELFDGRHHLILDRIDAEDSFRSQF